MPKSKQSPALFELYSKGRAGGPRDELTDRIDADDAVSGFRATVASVARSIGGGERDAPDEDALPRSQITRDGGCVRVVLTARVAGVIACVLVAAAGAVFVAGHWVGRQGGLADGRVQAQRNLERSAVDEIERARRSQPVEDLFANIGASPVMATDADKAAARVVPRTQIALTATRAPSTGTPWVKGNTYVVVQCFRGDARADALKAREYLASQSIESEIFGSSQRGYRLIATQGFNRNDATQSKLADRFLHRVRTLGAAYFRSGGRYELEGFFATLTTDSW